jgi:hypothetical protein
MAIRPAVDHIELAVAAVAEHHDLLEGEVHAHDGVADGEGFDGGVRFRDDGGVQRVGGFFMVFGFGLGLGLQDILPAGFGFGAAGSVARVGGDAAAVAAQAGGDMLGGVVEGASPASPSPRTVMPRPAWTLMSQVKKLRALLKVTCASSA